MSEACALRFLKARTREARLLLPLKLCIIKKLVFKATCYDEQGGLRYCGETYFAIIISWMNSITESHLLGTALEDGGNNQRACVLVFKHPLIVRAFLVRLRRSLR